MIRLDRACAVALLDALEDAELPLLSWGVTSGFLAHDEVLEIIDRHELASEGHSHGSPEEVLDSLLRSALLFRLPGSSPARYRTRLAETVRLAARLRQLFGPADLNQPTPNWWEQGRTLVTDYRLHVAPRRYPRRELPLTTCLAELDDGPGWSALQADIAAAQAGDRQLARFQLDATLSIYRSLRDTHSRGVIIGAGTGSGKTLAFYLPAFAAMAPGLRPNRFGVHTLALYPRKELLRDQLREAASAAHAVVGVLDKAGSRHIRIGALYGDTPATASDRRLTDGRNEAWRIRGQDLICPYLPCPRCHSELLWTKADRTRGSDRLRCASCGLILDDLALTRESMQARPPDLLFTTTEMLNRNASAPSLGRLLGWRSTAPQPRLVLLDEVHTYAGVHGAQVALLLRRWRGGLRGPATFVGLSATLRDAAAFFAQLTGLEQASVDYIEPHQEDLEVEGREYAIALRADPVSGASMLSTSIQTAMLYGRVLDTPGHEDLHGSTGFLFTDDLDVTNRFYDNLRDAEGGQTRSGRRGRRPVLAGLRSADAPFAADRYIDGQSWDLVQRIGWPLDPLASAGELRIGRTSSQDSGVDRTADLIVATASLEVGYNDPRVGLILQHKAPHDAAAFIQRRGRAGRTRGTRPWTVVTLSDYGRDRLAYQAYDTLFAPEIPPRNLPVGNRFVLKIQGTQALLDWLGIQLNAAGHNSDPRELLRAPWDKPRVDQPAYNAVSELLDATLRDGSLQDSLAEHLRRYLDIDADEVQAVLWEQPRALMLAVIPTALRRMRSQWRPVTRDPGANPGVLLPEFLTTALFDPLNVPEVLLQLPFADEPEALPIERALREAVPGRVSRRFGHRRDEHRTWLPVLASGGSVDVADFTTFTREGIWQPVGLAQVQVVRPHTIRLQSPRDDITDQAQGTPVWGSQILAPEAGIYQADLPDPSAWGGHVISAGFATHAAGNPAEVRRMTTGADCQTIYRNGRSVSSSMNYMLDGSPAALGFRLAVDGMRLELARLDLDKESVVAHLRSPAWRTFAFTAAIAEDQGLNNVTNGFQRTWLTLVYLTTFTLAFLDDAKPLEQIHAKLRGGAWRSELPGVLRVLYRDSTTGTTAPERLVSTLTDLSNVPAVCASLDKHGSLLWAADINDRTTELAQRAYLDTVAAAVLAATMRACPDAQDRDLIVDVVPWPDASSPATIWLTETSAGGLGLIERLVRLYSEDPRRFWGLVDSALGPSDYEYVDATVTRLLKHLAGTPASPAAQAMAHLRNAPSARDADLALQDLRTAWADLDGHPRQAAVAALSARLLRPGTTSSTDAVALAVLEAWDRLQDHLGFEVDARVIAYAAGANKLAVPSSGRQASADQVFSMLWPRGSSARAQHLIHYQPYASTQLLDRLLAIAAHEEHVQAVDVTQPDWSNTYAREMAQHGIVALEAPASQVRELGDALRLVPTIGVDRDVIRVYGETRQITRIGSQLRAVIELREALQ